jgi:hypothetical protein
VGPVVLIALGVLLLLSNLGVLPTDTWRSLWQWWPILIVLLGIELLLTGRASWGAVLFAVLVLGAAALFQNGLPAVAMRGVPPRASLELPGGNRFEQPLQGARQANVEINHGAGRLEVSGGAREGLIAEGTVTGVDLSRLRNRYRVQDGTGNLDLSLTRGNPFGWLGGRDEQPDELQVKLSPGVPIRRLEIDSGAAEVRLDLSELQVQTLEVDTGASSARVLMPKRGTTSGSITAGASSLAVEIPEGVPARIRVEGGLAEFKIDEQRFPRVRNEGVGGLAVQREYRSPDFDNAPNRVDLKISAGVAAVEVR